MVASSATETLTAEDRQSETVLGLWLMLLIQTLKSNLLSQFKTEIPRICKVPNKGPKRLKFI